MKKVRALAKELEESVGEDTEVPVNHGRSGPKKRKAEDAGRSLSSSEIV